MSALFNFFAHFGRRVWRGAAVYGALASPPPFGRKENKIRRQVYNIRRENFHLANLEKWYRKSAEEKLDARQMVDGGWEGGGWRREWRVVSMRKLWGLYRRIHLPACVWWPILLQWKGSRDRETWSKPAGRCLNILIPFFSGPLLKCFSFIFLKCWFLSLQTRAARHQPKVNRPGDKKG